MEADDIWFGEKLKNLVVNPLPIRNPLIEQFLYERTVLMTYASSGVGKSIICLCACLEASSGSKVFSFFECERPLKIYYILGERDIYEPAERMQLMRQAIDINYDNFYVDEGVIGRNLLDRASENWLIERLNIYMPEVDIIVFDPIYSFAFGGLSSPEKATAFAQFSTRIQKKFKCSIWHNNHTVKYTTELVNNKYVEKEDPFMGSELLKAHINVMYYVKQKENLVSFKCTKDSHNTAMHNFNLRFSPETYALKLEQVSDLTAMEKANAFIAECKRLGKDFTFNDFYTIIQPSSLRYTQKVLGVTQKKGFIKNVSGKFDNALYHVL